MSLLSKASTRLAMLVMLALASCVKAPQTALDPGPAASRERSAELVTRAQAFAAQSDFLRAEQYLNAALAEGADERHVLPLLVRACIADQRYRDAAQYLENHLRRHPGDGSARFLLGSVHYSLGHAELAIKELTRLLGDHPDLADAHYLLAVLLRDDIGNPAEADRHFREYLRLDPGGIHAEEAQDSSLTRLP